MKLAEIGVVTFLTLPRPEQKIFSEAATARHVQRDRENIFHFMGAVRALDEALPSGLTSGLASAAELMLP